MLQEKYPRRVLLIVENKTWAPVLLYSPCFPLVWFSANKFVTSNYSYHYGIEKNARLEKANPVPKWL